MLKNALLALALCGVIVATPCMAHAKLQSSTPANNAKLTQAPKTLTLNFSEAAQLAVLKLAHDGQEIPVPLDKNAKAGQVQYRTDKGGIVACTIGRASFAPEQLKSNLLALIDALNKAKPQGTKGIYLRKISVSSTMGAGVRVDTASVTQQAAA